MNSFASPARGALKAVATAGAVAVTFAAASFAGAAPAEAQMHPEGFHRSGGFHHGFHQPGGFGHHAFGHGHRGFGDGAGRHFEHRGFGYRTFDFGHRAFGYGYRRFSYGHRGYGLRGYGYGYGLPYGAYAGRPCPVGRHFVYGLGCRRNFVRYGYVAPAPVYAFRYGFGRIIHPRVLGHVFPRRSGTFGLGFRHFGHGGEHFHRHGFYHAGFDGGHRGHFRRG